MNHDFVADSSVGIAWVVASQSSEATDRLLDDVESGRRLVVPVLWAFEAANTLLVLGAPEANYAGSRFAGGPGVKPIGSDG